MTIKLAVIATSKNNIRMLDRLKSIAGDQMEVVLQLGDKNAPFKGSSMSRMKATYGTTGHLMEDNTYSGDARDFIQSPEYFRLRDVFADHMNRTSDRYKYKSHKLENQQDFHDYHHILVDTMAHKVKESGATHCLFFNVPHLAYDTALYQVAQTLGLKITILTQSLFPNVFHSMSDPVYNGSFHAQEGDVPFPIEKGSKPDLFYMKGIKQEREEGGRITLKAIAQLMTFLALKRPLQAFNPFYLWRVLSHMQRIYGEFPKWRDPFADFFHTDAFEFFDHMATFEDQKVDLSGDFVYFPLHMQPEMTTSALGDRFRDQAYAIERLSELLPEGVRILVKENPKQGAYMRGPLFFHRLKRIPKVTILPSWADTYALSGAAKFVATVTGTAGWEAISCGPPSLIFGNAWYRKLPGVVEFTENVTYDEIVSTEIDHEALQQATGSLLARSHTGVVDRHYVAMMDDFNDEENTEGVAQTLWGLLTGETDYAFRDA